MKFSENRNCKRIPEPVSTVQPIKMKMKIKIKIKVNVKKGDNAVVKPKLKSAQVEATKNEPEGNLNTSENNNMPENKITVGKTKSNQSDFFFLK